jgi:hypothetical protein
MLGKAGQLTQAVAVAVVATTELLGKQVAQADRAS